jgi:hypothetical protein
VISSSISSSSETGNEGTDKNTLSMDVIHLAASDTIASMPT